MSQFNFEVNSYLIGKKFSNGYNVRLSEKKKGPLTMRLDKLQELAKNKNVLHLGFADHLPLIKEKIKKNNWLHKRLVDSSTRCVGIDIDEELVQFVKNEIGINDVLKLDITTDPIPDSIQEEIWDYMIIGEVLEHIDNPVNFLNSIYSRYKNIVKQVVLTVPNAHDLLNVKNLFKSVECINTDHRYWFTPYTLAKVGTRAGLTISWYEYCQSYMPGKSIDRIMIRRFPMLRESILMVFDLK